MTFKPIMNLKYHIGQRTNSLSDFSSKAVSMRALSIRRGQPGGPLPLTVRSVSVMGE